MVKEILKSNYIKCNHIAKKKCGSYQHTNLLSNFHLFLSNQLRILNRIILLPSHDISRLKFVYDN